MRISVEPAVTVTSGIERTEKPDGVRYIEIASIPAVALPDSGGTKIITHRFRIEITSFPDIENSAAELSMWMSEGWKFVHRLSPRKMQTANGLREIYDEPKDELLEENFHADRDELLRIASSTCF